MAATDDSMSVDPILAALRQSPLFQLSLSSKELFHSNFLAWLCETYPQYAGRLFADFLSHAPPTYDRLCVYRERHNIDLWIEYPGGGELLIENKVKSLPAKQQLEEYAATVSNNPRADFLLLSLTHPAFLSPNERLIHLSNGTVWHYLTYRELADKFRDLLPHIRAINKYHGLLLNDYIHFITHLDALQRHFDVDGNDKQGNFFGVQNRIKRDLKPIRLHDLIDKMRYARLSECVSDARRKDGFSIIHENLCNGHDCASRASVADRRHDTRGRPIGSQVHRYGQRSTWQSSDRGCSGAGEPFPTGRRGLGLP